MGEPVISSTPLNKQAMKRARVGSDSCLKCDRMLNPNEKNYTCSICELTFCFPCTKISKKLHEAISMDKNFNFKWTCNGCNLNFPSMSSLTTQLKDIDMTNKESFKSLVKRIDQFDSKVDEKVKVKVDSLKTVVVSEVTDTIKDNVSDQIRREVRELDQQKLRSLNLMCFYMVESKSANSKERQRSDEEQFRNLCGAIGIDTVEIKSMFRIGIPKSGSNRPLKIVLNNKRERKQILDKVRLIKSVDDKSLKKCVITKDFTPRQREENKANVMNVRRKVDQNRIMSQMRMMKKRF